MKISCNVIALQRSIICCQSCRSAIRRLLVGPGLRPAVAAKRGESNPPLWLLIFWYVNLQSCLSSQRFQ